MNIQVPTTSYFRGSETVYNNGVLVGSAILSSTVSFQCIPDAASNPGLHLRETVASFVLLSPPASFYPTFPALCHDAIPVLLLSPVSAATQDVQILPRPRITGSYAASGALK
jgi:hypothetical protein